MAKGRDITGFSIEESIIRGPDEKLIRTTTVLSEHEGFHVELQHEVVYQKAKPIGEKCYRCVIFDDGVRVCFPIPCPPKPKRPKDGTIAI